MTEIEIIKEQATLADTAAYSALAYAQGIVKAAETGGINILAIAALARAANDIIRAHKKIEGAFKAAVEKATKEDRP
jgi:hypothetical protein